MTIIKKEKTGILKAQMFGGFTLSYDGRLITGKAKSSETQFNYLMQLLIHAGGDGVSKELLASTLFASRELNNINHAIQSVIYNAKRRLSDYGLPDVNYIYQNDGLYYFTDEIEVEEDARVFERLISQSESEKDVQKKIRYLLDGIHLYTGDFLENQIGVVWITRENWRYRQLFVKTVNQLAGLLKEQGMFAVLEDVGKLATRIQPFSDWETLTMEAYISSGKYDEAYKLYESTVELYLHEQGIRPSNKMFELLSRLGSQFEHSPSVLEEIQQGLNETDHAGGGYVCSYPVFQGVYQALQRITERNGQNAYLMLCTIVDTKGNSLTKGKNLDELSERLQEAIRTTVRRSDVLNKYGKNQYLVLLMNTTLENCQIIQKRINDKFVINRQRITVKYHVSSIW